ncbi:MAG: NADH-quinone oxidoreductase subunit L [Opitutae bacterium]|nr:NADH-quinone oxidoreductase subunit L [Opitutae bacterium]
MAATGVLALGSMAAAVKLSPNELTTFPFSAHAITVTMEWLEVAMGLFVVYVGIRHRRPLIALLMVAQMALMLWFAFRHGAALHTEHNLFADKFSVIMALIIGITGGLICLYALGYMREFHVDHHPEFKDRRPLFFALLFIFLGAMFGVVFSNNLLWLYFFWEVTTLCSFLLIGYKQNTESTQNALRALTYNLIGGLAFAVGIVWFFLRGGSIELSVLIKSAPAVALVPAALLAFAGLTKSAQFPFTGWLLGAMVAPTPVSALLHSATMVKAGVYLIVRLAPVLQGSFVGIVIALIGAVTFMIGSFAAIGTSDAKKVLAYSTVANLGLIVICGGIGTYEAVWAGVLLIVFHAVAKCLLFLCVGAIEHKLHSRDIEKMAGLVLTMPRMSVMLQIGIAGMFLAPFGMLISKWAVLKAVVDAYPLITLFLVFGSAPTLFFWVKWLGKLLQITGPLKNVEAGIGRGEWFALSVLSALTILTCIFFPLISKYLVEPYVTEIYGQSGHLAYGNFLIMSLMLVMVSLFPLSFFNYGWRGKVMDSYLGGANAGGSTKYHGAAGAVREVQMSNYYFGDILNEAKVFRAGVVIGLMLSLVLAGSLFSL